SKRCFIRTSGTCHAPSVTARTWSGACSPSSSAVFDPPPRPSPTSREGEDKDQGAGLRLRRPARRYGGPDLRIVAAHLSGTGAGAAPRTVADHHRDGLRAVRS